MLRDGVKGFCDLNYHTEYIIYKNISEQMTPVTLS